MKTMRFDVTVNFQDDMQGTPEDVKALIMEVLMDDGALVVRIDTTSVPIVSPSSSTLH